MLACSSAAIRSLQHVETCTNAAGIACTSEMQVTAGKLLGVLRNQKGVHMSFLMLMLLFMLAVRSRIGVLKKSAGNYDG